MTNNNNHPRIVISKETKMKLDEFGSKSYTYDTIIKNLITIATEYLKKRTTKSNGGKK